MKSDEIYKRLYNIRLDRYAVQQGMMLNCLVGALTAIAAYQDDKGKIDAADIVDAVEKAYRVSVVNN